MLVLVLKELLVRKVPGDGPIKTPLLANITCNEGAVPIPGRTGQVTAGTGVKFYWNECELSLLFWSAGAG